MPDGSSKDRVLRLLAPEARVAESKLVLKTLLGAGKGLRVTKSDPAQLLPNSVQKSYFMLTDAERGVLNTAPAYLGELPPEGVERRDRGNQ